MRGGGRALRRMGSAFSSGAGIMDEMLGYAVPLEVSERR